MRVLVGLGGGGGLDKILAVGGECGWRGGRQVGRCACGFTPAFGRAVGPRARRVFMARLKPCPFDDVVGGRDRFSSMGIPPVTKCCHGWGTRLHSGLRQSGRAEGPASLWHD
jgi:hypothetical protein